MFKILLRVCLYSFFISLYSLTAIAEDPIKSFHDAVLNGHIETVKKFIEPESQKRGSERGDGINTNNELTSLPYLLWIGRRVDINVKDKDGMTALHLAVWRKNIKMVSYLLEQGADINARSDISAGMTALLIAARFGATEIAKKLIEHEADINAKDKDGMTALHLAVWNGNIEIVSYLLEQGANIYTKDNEGRIPLHFAIESNHTEIVKKLKELDTRNPCIKFFDRVFNY